MRQLLSACEQRSAINKYTYCIVLVFQKNAISVLKKVISKYRNTDIDSNIGQYRYNWVKIIGYFVDFIPVKIISLVPLEYKTQRNRYIKIFGFKLEILYGFQKTNITQHHLKV